MLGLDLRFDTVHNGCRLAVPEAYALGSKQWGGRSKATVITDARGTLSGSGLPAPVDAAPEPLWMRVFGIGIIDLFLAPALTAVWLLLTLPNLSIHEFGLVRLPMIVVGPIAVLRPARWWPYMAFATVATWWVHELVGFDRADALGHSLAEVGITVGACVLARALDLVPLRSVDGAWRLVGIAVAVAVARAVFISFHLEEVPTGSRWPEAALGAGAGVSVLVFLPLVILLADGLRHWTTTRRHLSVELPMFAALTLLLWLVFYAPHGDRPLGMAFLIIPVLAMFAARMSQLAVGFALAATVIMVSGATDRGLGPFSARLFGMDPFNLQVFLLSVVASVWFVVGALEMQLQASRSLADVRDELQRQVDTDLVTGLRSRSWMIAELRHLLELGTEVSGRVAVMFIDLTSFLSINRALGYGAGDEIIRMLAAVTRDAVSGEFHLGRFDGHNFVLIVPDAEDVDALERVAHNLLTAIAREVVVDGQRISRTGSIGIAVSSRDSTATNLLRDADLALVIAKAKGRSRIHRFVQSSGGGDAAQGIHLEHELRDALAERRFVVHFQPQVWLETGLVSGYEALARWDHPDKGLLAPSAFLEMMESSGLIIQLGQQVTEYVCHVIATTPDLPGPISVNVSAVEFADEDWFDRFTCTVLEAGIRPELLVIELTETTVLSLTDDTVEALAGIRSLGIGIHVDDFGTGYASVGMLQHVPATALKLDRSFIAPMRDCREVNVPLVRGIAGLADGLGLETIAEGIETAEQAELLRQAGWHIGQGYLFGRPRPDLLW